MLVQSVPSLAAIAAQASLDAMVICAMVGCSNRTCWAKSTNRNFFRLPKIVEHQGQRTKELCERRRRLWLARINRSDLNEGAGVRVCGAHFVMGRPAKLWQEWDPDWAPSLLLGYSAEHGDRLERVHAAAVSPSAEPITEEDDSDSTTGKSDDDIGSVKGAGSDGFKLKMHLNAFPIECGRTANQLVGG